MFKLRHFNFEANSLYFLRHVHTIQFQGSGSWFRKLDASVQTVRFQGSPFVGAFHLSRRVSDGIRAVLFPSVFQNPCVRRSFLLCLHDLIFGTKQNSDRVKGPLRIATFNQKLEYPPFLSLYDVVEIDQHQRQSYWCL